MERLHSGPSEDYITQVFSCKEAAFKAIFPIVGEFFEFCDFEISMSGSEFQAAMKGNSRSAQILASGRGTVATRDGLIATTFYVQ